MRPKKYLIGGQVKLDKNKDGELTGEDFELMRTKKKGMYAKGGMQMYAKHGTMVKALKKYANGGETDPVKKGDKREAAKSDASSELEKRRAIKTGEREAYQLQIKTDNALARSQRTAAKTGGKAAPDPKLNRRLEKKSDKQYGEYESLNDQLLAANERLLSIYDKYDIPESDRASRRRKDKSGAFETFKGKDGKQHFNFLSVKKPFVQFNK